MNALFSQRPKSLLAPFYFLLLTLLLLSVVEAADEFTQGIPYSGENTQGTGAETTADQTSETVTAQTFSSITVYQGLFMTLLMGTDLNSNHAVIQLMVPIILRLLVPLYMALIVITGIYFIWGAFSPRSRAQSKTQLQKLMIGLIACGLSPVLFDGVIGINNFLVSEILNSAGIVYWDPILNVGTAAVGVGYLAGVVGLILVLTCGVGLPLILPIVCMLVSMLLMPYLVLLVRYIAVLVFGILFPLTIFFQSFDFLKGLGYKLMKQTLTWIFMPVPMAIFIVLTQNIGTGWSRLNPVAAVGALASFILIGLAPMMITSMLGVMGGGFIYVGQNMGNTRLVFMGYVMRGYSAAALTSAAFHAQRSEARAQSQRESTRGGKGGYSIPTKGSGPPTGAASAQPPPPYTSKSTAGYGGQTGSGAGGGAPKVYGNRTVSEGGGVSGIFDRGNVGATERLKRAAFDRAVTAGTRPEEMTARQYYGVRAAMAKSTVRKAFWAGAGLMSAVSPKRLMMPAGYMLRGLLRHSIGDWPIGRTLMSASWKMTGYWEYDNERGKNVFNYGWQSVKGIRRDSARSAGAIYKQYEKGKGAPPMAKAMMTGVGIALPAVALAAPLLPAGIGVAGALGLVALRSGLGVRLLKPVGERLDEEGEIARKIRSAVKKKEGEERRPLTPDEAKKEVWDSLSDKQKERFRYDPWKDVARASLTEDEGKDRAFRYYAGAATSTAAATGFARLTDDQKKMYGYDPALGRNVDAVKSELDNAGRQLKSAKEESMGGSLWRETLNEVVEEKYGPGKKNFNQLSAQEQAEVKRETQRRFGEHRSKRINAGEEGVKKAKKSLRKANEEAGNAKADAEKKYSHAHQIYDDLDGKARREYLKKAGKDTEEAAYLAYKDEEGKARDTLAAGKEDITKATMDKAVDEHMQKLDKQNDTWAYGLGVVDRRIWMHRASRELGPDTSHSAILSRAKDMAHENYGHWTSSWESKRLWRSLSEEKRSEYADKATGGAKKTAKELDKTEKMRAMDMAYTPYRNLDEKPEASDAAKSERLWNRLSDSQKDEMAKIATGGDKKTAGDLGEGEEAKAKYMAYNMGVRGERSLGRHVYKSAYQLGEDEASGKRRKASVARSILLHGGAFGLLSYEMGRAENEGTYNYESRRVNTKIKLDEGDYKKDRRGTIVGGDGTTYSLRGDGSVYRSENQWGKGMVKTTQAEADTVREWDARNRYKRTGAHDMGGVLERDKNEDDAKFQKRAADWQAKEGTILSTYTQQLDDLSYRQANRFDFESARKRLGEGISNELTAKEREMFGWRRGATKQENEAANQSIIEYFQGMTEFGKKLREEDNR